MTSPFTPHQPEKMVNKEISVKEFVLLTKLRKCPFGKFVVHKANNILVRIEIQDSQLIKENGIDLDD